MKPGLGVCLFRGTLEAIIYIGIAVSWILLLPVSRAYAGDASHQAMGGLLLALNDWISPVLAIVFILGTLMFYLVLYRAKLVPRWISGWGLVAAIPYLPRVF